MEESERIVFDIITLIFPEWIEKQKNRYRDMEDYNKYKQIILDVFGYDIERATSEQERTADVSDLERKIEIMKLIRKLQETEKKKKRKRK